MQAPRFPTPHVYDYIHRKARIITIMTTNDIDTGSIVRDHVQTNGHPFIRSSVHGRMSEFRWTFSFIRCNELTHPLTGINPFRIKWIDPAHSILNEWSNGWVWHEFVHAFIRWRMTGWTKLSVHLFVWAICSIVHAFIRSWTNERINGSTHSCARSVTLKNEIRSNTLRYLLTNPLLCSDELTTPFVRSWTNERIPMNEIVDSLTNVRIP